MSDKIMVIVCTLFLAFVAIEATLNRQNNEQPETSSIMVDIVVHQLHVLKDTDGNTMVESVPVRIHTSGVIGENVPLEACMEQARRYTNRVFHFLDPTITYIVECKETT
jgi:hypothetical protein